MVFHRSLCCNGNAIAHHWNHALQPDADCIAVHTPRIAPIKLSCPYLSYCIADHPGYQDRQKIGQNRKELHDNPFKKCLLILVERLNGFAYSLCMSQGVATFCINLNVRDKGTTDYFSILWCFWQHCYLLVRSWGHSG